MMMAVGLFAQQGESNIGIQIGFNRPIDHYRTNPMIDTLNMKTVYNGMQAGVVYETTFIKGFGMSIGLNYGFGVSQGKWTYPNPGYTIRQKVDQSYQSLMLPVDWQYKFEIAKQTYLMLYTGPTIEVGLSKKMVRREQIGEQVNSVTTNLYEQDQDGDKVLDQQRLNIQWGVGAGFQYKQYFLRGGYDFGIINSYRDRWYGETYRFRGRMDGWQIRVGMYLWQFK